MTAWWRRAAQAGLGAAIAVVVLYGSGSLSPGMRAAVRNGQLPPDVQERFERMSREAEARGLAEPFRGITTDGTVMPRLFTIASTGVSTAPVVEAATAFLDSLDGGMRARATFPADDPEWRKWMNQHFYRRQGVGFVDMNDAQRTAALNLLKASLSAKGLALSRDIMRLNHTLGELNGDNFAEYGEWLYYLTVMGTPSATEPWGWQLDGHHLIVNYFVLGDQVVMTPSFFGSEPVTATSGKYKGVSVMQEEQNEGLALLNALTEAQRAKAVLQGTKTSNNSLTEAFRDNVVLDYAGIPAKELTDAQRSQLLKLIGLYVGNMAERHAKVKMEEIRRHFDSTYFAWIGGHAPDAVFYYRIHSPVILIEFDHQRPVGLRRRMPGVETPIRDHIHAVIRTPNGNDYGKDLLRQHYAAHPH
ncbi:MAG TPA: DUF3500 domain-containing protein [Vicinamibacterales bacterium]